MLSDINELLTNLEIKFTQQIFLYATIFILTNYFFHYIFVKSSTLKG